MGIYQVFLWGSESDTASPFNEIRSVTRGFVGVADGGVQPPRTPPVARAVLLGEGNFEARAGRGRTATRIEDVRDATASCPCERCDSQIRLRTGDGPFAAS